MDTTAIAGKFTDQDVSSLRSELLQSGLDTWQAGELLASFLAVRGFGVSPKEARQAVSRIESPHCSLEAIQSELETIARVM